MKSPTAVVVLLLALAFVGCRASGAIGAPVEVAFTTLAEGSGSELDSTPQGVIRTASGLERLWAKLPEDASPPPPIDFGREMVVYATRGVIERVVADSGFVRVELGARTSGFHVVRLARSEAPVQFEPPR